MKYLARWVVAFALSGAAFSLLVQAQPTTPAHGGGGGNSFSLDCGIDQVLVGVRGRKGNWLDRLQATCTKVSTNGNWVGGLILPTETAGSGSGATFDVICPRNTAVRGISGSFGWYVNRLKLRCRPLGATGEFSNIYASGAQSGDHAFGVDFCPNLEPARGLYGRASGYIDSAGLVCHSGTSPRLQVLAAPSDLIAVNLVTTDGPTTTAVTPFVQIQWTDRSTIEQGFLVEIVGGGLQPFNRPAAADAGSRQALTITSLSSGSHFARVCARFNAADGGNQCTPQVLFRIAAAATCSPVITSTERIGASTFRVRWSHGCNNPTNFVVMLRCGDGEFGNVAITSDGTARQETFTVGVGDGALQVCASFPGQTAMAFCSAPLAFPCN